MNINSRLPLRGRGWRPSPSVARNCTASAAVILCLALVSSCSGQGKASGDGSHQTELTIALPQEPTTLASWNSWANDGHPVLRNIHEALLNRDPETNELVPELALSWKAVDKLTWQFTLRKGVKFHDGSPFNAKAAAEGLNYVLDKKNAFPILQFMGPAATAAAVDEYTLKVTTEAPDPILPSRLYFVTIPSVKELNDSPGRYAEEPVGTGPYMIESWKRGQSITLVANKDWWGRGDAKAAHGTNEVFQKVTFLFRPEDSVRAAMLKTGEADFARWLSPEECKSAPVCLSATGVETAILRIDTPYPSLADVRVREAIALSFDKSTIMKDIMGGGEPAGQIVGPSALGYNKDLKPYPYDPARARALINEARADGVPVDMPLLLGGSTGLLLRGDEILETIAAGMRDVGLKNVRTSMRETATHQHQYVMAFKDIPKDRGLLATSSHGNELMDYGNSVGSYYTCGGAVSAYCNPKVDSMYKKAVELGGNERDAALQEIAAYVYDEVPIVPIGRPEFHFGLSKSIKWKPRLDGLILVKEMGLN